MNNPTFLAWLKSELVRWSTLPQKPGLPFTQLASSGMSGGEDALAPYAPFANLAQPAGQGWRQEISQDGGYKTLREKVAELYGAPSADNVLIVSGATQANFVALSCLRATNGPRTRVLVEAPGYGPLFEVPDYLGFTTSAINRPMEDGYKFKIIDGTNAEIAVVSNPHNPSGVLVGNDEIQRLLNLVSGAVVVDETFMTRADMAHSAVRLNDPRVIVLGSLSKTFGMGFLKAGWIIAQGELLERLRALWTIGFNIGSKITESIATEALKDHTSHDRRTTDLGKANLELVSQTLDALQKKGLLEWKNPGQGSIAFPKLNLGGKPEIWKFYRNALENHRLAILPGHWFDPLDDNRTEEDSPVDRDCHHHIRIGFGGPTDQVRLGLERLRAAIEGHE